MRSNKFIIPAVLVLLLAVTNSCSKESVSVSGTDDSMLIQTKSSVSSDVWSAYDYCKEDGYWTRFTSFDERMKSAQLPESLLQSCSAEELIVLCLNNPMTHIYTSYNNELVAIDAISDGLNVIKELELREDAADAILSFCQSMLVEPSKSVYCTYKDGHYRLSSMTYNFLKLYIGSGRLPSLFESDRRKTLETVFDTMYDYEMSRKEMFSNLSITRTALILKELDSGVSITPQDAKRIYHELLSLGIATKSRTYSHVLRGSFTIYTPNNTPMTAFLFYELPPNELDEINEDYRVRYGYDAIIEPASGTYNCHSYAWYITENPLNYTSCWLNRSIVDSSCEDILAEYWRDGSFHMVETEAEAVKIYYGNGDHSAVKASEPNYYISKMGLGPLVKHLPHNVDYDLGDMRYYAYGSGTVQRDTTIRHEDEIIGNLPSVMTIYGQSSVVVGQTYTYYVLPESGDADIHWSCISRRGSSSDYYMSSTTGSSVTIRFDSVGSYSLMASCSYSGGNSSVGTLMVRVVDSL